jgi:hypothetical protein
VPEKEKMTFLWNSCTIFQLLWFQVTINCCLAAGDTTSWITASWYQWRTGQTNKQASKQASKPTKTNVNWLSYGHISPVQRLLRREAKVPVDKRTSSGSYLIICGWCERWVYMVIHICCEGIEAVKYRYKSLHFQSTFHTQHIMNPCSIIILFHCICRVPF